MMIKKKRGLRRYYKNLARRNEFLGSLEWIDFSGWFDFWHEHFDSQGYGSKSFKSRILHLNSYLLHYDYAAKILSKKNSKFQIWIFLNDFNSADDALYIHTPNPNQSEFPYKYLNYSVESNLKNTELKNYIDSLSSFKKIYGELINDQGKIESFCTLYRSNVGEPVN